MNSTEACFLRMGIPSQTFPMRKILIHDGCRAFTLIEMVTVVAIIMILSILAISSFLHARNHAYEISAKHDLRNLIEFEEAYFAENDRYKSYASPSDFPGMKLSPGVTVETAGNPDSPSSFTAKSWHTRTNKLYIYHFDTGLFVETTTP